VGWCFPVRSSAALGTPGGHDEPVFGVTVDDEIRLAMPLDRHAQPLFAMIDEETGPAAVSR
jgi:hypothetical protein